MNRMIAAAVIALLTAGADRAAAQTPDERIEKAIAHAQEVGVPVALLQSKIAEGKAKGIPMDRIAAAVEHRSEVLERAGQALHGQSDVAPADVNVAADALESGVSEAVLRTIAQTAPKDRRLVAIAALEQLVQLGHTPEAALDRVREALKRGPEALLNLPAEAARGRGAAPPQTPSGAPVDGAHAAPPAGVPGPGTPPQPTRPAGPPTAGRSGR